MLQIYNTQTRKKEKFIPVQENKVGMYACGVTVYDYTHLGHARALITYDMIYRYLEYLGYEVNFVRNFTDVDDKIIKRSHEQGIPFQELTSKFIQAFHEDTTALGLKRPTHEPLATEHIQEIITLVKQLQEKGLAYTSGNDVFYAIRNFAGYGKLSGKNIDDLEAGSRVEVSEAKHNPMDFALWKSAKPDEPKWESPWGQGRPGWHIECSAMSMKYLGETLDIHCGGKDLVFPHHENEVAQSEGVTGKPFANYWVHNGFINIDSEKMSKSLGNFLTIRDILAKFPGEVIRLFMFSSHYRSPIDYNEQNIYNSVTSLERFYQTIKRLQDFLQNHQGMNQGVDRSVELEKFRIDFQEAMNDDFNTAKVVGQAFEWVRLWNKALDENNARAEDVEVFLGFLAELHGVLGIFGSDPQGFLDEIKNKAMSGVAFSKDDIEKLIAQRKQARLDKNFKRADEIRNELLQKGVALKDNPDGTTSWTLS